MLIRTKGLILLLVVLFILSSCASMQVKRRVNELNSILNPLLGSSKEDVVLAMGVPTNTKWIGGVEVYQYFQSYGARGNVWVAPSDYLITAGAKKWEAYDKINVYFKNDRMVKWDGYVQR